MGKPILEDNQFYIVDQMPKAKKYGDHGGLTGLSDDDHAQYHNDARGDARYYTQGQIDTTISGLEATAVDDAAITATGTAGVIYTATEQGMINALIADVSELKDQLNALMAAMRTAGTLETP